MNIWHLFAVLIIAAVLISAYLYGRRTRRWKWSEYFLLAAAPVAGAAVLAFTSGVRVILFFLLSAAMGVTAELALGFLTEKTLGRKMWIYNYKRFALGRYTSLLTLPFWGGAGLLFWLLAELLGL